MVVKSGGIWIVCLSLLAEAKLSQFEQNSKVFERELHITKKNSTLNQRFLKKQHVRAYQSPHRRLQRDCWGRL